MMDEPSKEDSGLVLVLILILILEGIDLHVGFIVDCQTVELRP